MVRNLLLVTRIHAARGNIKDQTAGTNKSITAQI